MTPVVAAKKLSKFDPKKFLSTVDFPHGDP